MMLRAFKAPSQTLLVLVAAASVGLSGCSLASKIASIGSSPNKSIASKGERIPILTDENQLAQSTVLKGQTFFIPEAQPVVDWPLPGGNAEQSIEHAQAAPDFQIAWRRNIGMSGMGRPHFITAPPIEAEDRIFTMDAQARVTARDARSGQEVWSVNLQSHDRRDRDAYGGGVAYANGVVFVSSGYRFVAALDSKSGRTLWRTPTDSPIHAAPTVSDGRVFVVSLDDQLYSFDAKTGQALWSYQAIIEPARMLEASSPAIAGDEVVASFASGEVIAKRTVNGNDLWDQALSRSTRSNALSEIRDVAGRPIIFKGDVFAASHSGVFAAIDLRSGSQRWSLPVASFTTPWAAGDVVYIVSQSGQLICVSRESGQVYWIVDLNAPVVPVVDNGKKGRKGKAKPAPAAKKQITYWYGPVLASNRLVVVSDRGEIQARDPKTGAYERSIRVGAPMTLTPIAVNGMLYVVDDKAELIAIR